MEVDRNKTELTHKITAAVYRYLDERGCKPIETEVPIAVGWVADLAGLLCPTVTELVELKLLKRKPKWNQPGYEKWWEAAKERQSAIGAATVLVEVKASDGDFKNDKKWAMALPAQLCYVAVPQGLHVNSHLQNPWGILRYYEGGDILRCERPPELVPITIEQKFDTALQIAIRRDNQTRYSAHREFVKGIRIERNKEVSRDRVSKILHGMISVVKGEHGSALAALEYHGVRHVPNYLTRKLDELWGVGLRQEKKQEAAAAFNRIYPPEET